jgi:hypothetical protein
MTHFLGNSSLVVKIKFPEYFEISSGRIESNDKLSEWRYVENL